MSSTFSVVISTLNRAASLRATLGSLRFQVHDAFEVVVVNGPSTDDTEAVLADFSGHLTTASCPVANLSRSRNVGIAAASGDVVAFLDDDALPEPRWLAELDEGFDRDEVAGVGGLVFDHTGVSLQYAFSAADRFGNPSYSDQRSFEDLCFPGAWTFPYLQGTNAAFRRRTLEEIGGFDEEFEYYLDETDVCCRLVDAGYILRQLPRAVVHHKFLPSGVRNTNRVVTNWYPVVKNHVYFGWKHGRRYGKARDLLADAVSYVDARKVDVEYHAAAGNLSSSDVLAADAAMSRGLIDGLERGLRAGGRSEALRAAPAADAPRVLVPFPVVENPCGRRLRLALVSQEFPPDRVGGIGRFTADAARAFAERGHDVHVITSTGLAHDTVDLENGVWVHRIVKTQPRLPAPTDVDVPERIWANASSVAAEIVRLEHLSPIDLVYGPSWDLECIGVQRGTSIPVATRMETTFSLSLRGRPDWQADEHFMDSFGRPMLQLERQLFSDSELLPANSSAIAVESGFSQPFPRLELIPIGVRDRWAEIEPWDHDEHGPIVLFVGRFEHRKGADTVLEAIGPVLDHHPSAVFWLVGDDTLPTELGTTYRQAFEQTNADAPWFDRVRFLGPLPDAEVFARYAACDVFVAPSRFESFGLVYQEAAMFAKAIVACRSGALPEIVEHEVTGLLVEPGDAGALAKEVLRLLDDEELRSSLGAAARTCFEKRYEVTAAAERLETLFCRLIQVAWPDAGLVVDGPLRLVELVDGTKGIRLDGGTDVTLDVPRAEQRWIVVHVVGQAELVVSSAGESERVVVDGGVRPFTRLAIPSSGPVTVGCDEGGPGAVSFARGIALLTGPADEVR